MLQAFGKAQDRQCLAVAGRLNGDVPVELEIMAHAGAIGDVSDGAGLIDVVHHHLQGLEAGFPPNRGTKTGAITFQQAIADASGGGDFFIGRGIVEQCTPRAGRSLQRQERIDLRHQHALQEILHRLGKLGEIEEIEQTCRDPGITASPARPGKVVPPVKRPAMEPEPGMGIGEIAGMDQELARGFVDQFTAATACPYEARNRPTM